MLRTAVRRSVRNRDPWQGAIAGKDRVPVAALVEEIYRRSLGESGDADWSVWRRAGAGP